MLVSIEVKVLVLLSVEIEVLVLVSVEIEVLVVVSVEIEVLSNVSLWFGFGSLGWLWKIVVRSHKSINNKRSTTALEPGTASSMVVSPELLAPPPQQTQYHPGTAGGWVSENAGSKPSAAPEPGTAGGWDLSHIGSST